MLIGNFRPSPSFGLGQNLHQTAHKFVMFLLKKKNTNLRENIKYFISLRQKLKVIFKIVIDFAVQSIKFHFTK